MNSRLDELQAAVLRVKLSALHESIKQRQRLAAEYDARLGSNWTVTSPTVRGGCEHAYHQYVIRSEQRPEMMQHLQRAEIPVSAHYPVPLHRQPAFAGSHMSLPESERAAAEVISLPLHPYMSEAAVGAVCDAIERFDHANC